MQRETDLGQYIGKKGSDARGLERWEDSIYRLDCAVLEQVLGKETPGSLNNVSGSPDLPG